MLQDACIAVRDQVECSHAPREVPGREGPHSWPAWSAKVA